MHEKQSLFNDEEDVENEGAQEFQNEANKVPSSSSFSARETRRPHIENELETLDDEEDDDSHATLNIPNKPVAPPETNELLLLGLPLSIAMDMDKFDSAASDKREKAFLAQPDGTAVVNRNMPVCCIRTRSSKEDGTLQSNTRFVEFSDGSSALVIGETVFESDIRSSVQSVLIESSHQPIYFTHGMVKERRLFKPTNIAALENWGKKGPRKTKLATVQQGAELESRVRRQLEQQQLSPQFRRAASSRQRPLDASFLEGGGSGTED